MKMDRMKRSGKRKEEIVVEAVVDQLGRIKHEVDEATVWFSLVRSLYGFTAFPCRSFTSR